MEALILSALVLVLAGFSAHFLTRVLPEMRREAAQARVLAFRTHSKSRGRHARRSARHARARRILAAHTAR